MNKKAKILYASRAMESPPREGGFVLLKDIANNLSSSYQPFMLSATDKTHESISPEKVFRNTGWGRLEKIQFFWALLTRTSKYNLVHTAHIPTRANSMLMRLVVRAARKRGVKFIQTVTGLPRVTDSKLARLLWGDYLVFQSPSAMKRASMVTSTPAKLIIPWPSDKRVALDHERREKTRRSLKLNSDTKLVVFPGEFKRMGINIDFSDCIKEFVTKHPKSLIVLACRFDVQGLGKQLESMYPEHVRSLGGTSNIIELMEAADLVIFPTKKMDSKFHPPLIITEALSLGTKVLVSDKIDIDDSTSPLLSRIGDSVSWREFGIRMSSALTEGSDTKRTPGNNFAKMLESYESIYKSLLGGEK